MTELTGPMKKRSPSREEGVKVIWTAVVITMLCVVKMEEPYTLVHAGETHAAQA